MIVLPRFVSLDTSTITKLSKDFFGSDDLKRADVIAVRDGLMDRGWFLTLTSDHLIELAQHADNDIVVSRFKFLRTWQNLAWIWDVEKNGIGSFLDLDCFEIRAFIDKRRLSKKTIVDDVKSELLVIGLGAELFRDEDYDLWLQLADESKPGLAKSQSAVSILRSDPVPGVNDMKLSEFLNAEYEDVNDLPEKVRQLASVMAKQIKTHGDKRVEDAEDLAAGFYRQTVKHIGDIAVAQESNRNETAFIESVAAVFEIPASVIDLEMTVGDLGDWGHFSLMLKIYSRKLGRPLSLEEVRPDKLPSWSLRLKLRDFQNQADKVSGSDFGDRNLACLIPYLDSCEVDKRTMDYLRQITSKKQPDFDYLNHWFRCGDYRRLLEFLPE